MCKAALVKPATAAIGCASLCGATNLACRQACTFRTLDRDIQGNIKLVIDEATFTLSVPDSPRSPLALSTRAEAFPADLMEAMKSGKAH